MLAAALTGLTGSATAASTAEVPTSWRFAGIGASQTLIHVTANGGPCEAPGAPRVQETATSVRITTTSVRPDSLPGPCPAVVDLDHVYVRLAAPLAGRKLLGASPTALGIGLSKNPPRVVGLSPGDALSVLTSVRDAQGSPFKPVVARRAGGDGLRRVVSQKGARIVLAGSSTP